MQYLFNYINVQAQWTGKIVLSDVLRQQLPMQTSCIDIIPKKKKRKCRVLLLYSDHIFWKFRECMHIKTMVCVYLYNNIRSLPQIIVNGFFTSINVWWDIQKSGRRLNNFSVCGTDMNIAHLMPIASSNYLKPKPPSCVSIWSTTSSTENHPKKILMETFQDNNCVWMCK